MIFHEEGLRHLIAEVGVGHMVYGTDYPFDWPVGIDFILNASFLSNADQGSDPWREPNESASTDCLTRLSFGCETRFRKLLKEEVK